MKVETKRPRILVLDGATRAALAVVRSLGRCELEIGVVGESINSLASTSRYCDVLFRSPSISSDPAAYDLWLQELVKSWRPDLLIPITDRSLKVIVGNLAKYAEMTKLPLAYLESLRTVMDKSELHTYAAARGIKVPRTLVVSRLTVSDKERLITDPTEFVLKPRSSDTIANGVFQKPEVRYFSSGAALVSYLNALPEDTIDLLIQERISGEGAAVSTLFNRGSCEAIFCHRRLLEKPPTGGVSVLSESISADTAPVAEAVKLLTSLKWHGVAMVEFKRTAKNEFYLLEINPRFWGTTQLAIDSGIDLPRLLLEQELRPKEESKEIKVVTFPAYQVGARLRWWLGTLDHFFIRASRDRRSLLEMLLQNSLKIFNAPGKTRNETLRFSDITPGLVEIRNYIVENLLKTSA